MFKTNIIPSPKPFLSVAWSYNNTNIITHTNAGNTTASKYEGRIFLEVSTGSLELRNLRQNDSGIYSVSIIPALGPQMLGRTTLRVYEELSSAMLKGPTSLLLAGKSSANLTCEGTGSIVTTEWTRNGQPLHPSNGTTFSSDNKTVFISTVERDDAGVYQCKLSNPVSTTAANYSMVVNYGPENVKISGLTEVNNGLKATFTCSAASEPPANFSWSFNMKETDVTNATFTIEKASGFNTGNYTCTAWNRVTNVKDSATHEFSVTVPISEATIRGPKDPLLAGKSTAVLTCEANGSNIVREWSKDDHPLIHNSRTSFSYDNRTVTISPVERTDSGEYQCRLSNAISLKTANYTMTVNFGPLNVTINGTKEVNVGEMVAFVCSAVSVPPATFSWSFNGKEKHVTSATFTIEKTSSGDTGNYTCTAWNQITGHSSSVVQTLMVNGVPTCFSTRTTFLVLFTTLFYYLQMP
ncbi:carcinoembryonic antigen-related cell adhesion molecule 5-like [Denticeps clupeoides]|uniref:carcinoembryonic antigen-related cell adhesion molecule 5-like n=1 Tax=Denticeps clupeoides TaxID=299321 RepID=UPI0010A4D0CB|nr:carcinoembryonic antigen-related cell adhesion molecule 5-like [Denticeps clupeoides]